MSILRSLLVLPCLATLLLAEVANMSGTWKLNVTRSQWGKKTAPDSVVLTIQHKEPSFEYTGTAQAPNASPSKFSFKGAIDNKDYVVKDDDGTRRIRFTRKSDNTVASTQWSPDGKEEQTSTMILSSNGGMLTRRIRTKAPDNTIVEWTEVYEK